MNFQALLNALHIFSFDFSRLLSILQTFQNILTHVNVQVVAAIKKALHTKSAAAEADTTPAGEPTYISLFSTLAWQCASTFR